MSKHRPGPWAFFDQHPEKVVYHIRDKNHLHEIATIYRYESNPCDTLADARLIAAAPELLEAVDALVDFVKLIGSGGDPIQIELLNLARAAIAKAKGE